MGFIQKAVNWIVEVFPPLATVVKGVEKLLDTGKKVKEMYNTGIKILEREKAKEENKPNPNIIINMPSLPAPTYPNITLYQPQKKNNTRSDKDIQEIRKQQRLAEEAQKRLLLQTKILELLTTSQTIERFTNNIGLHAANLNIHYMSLKNTLGLLGIVNRQTKALKAIIAKVNYNTKLLNKGKVVKGGKLEEINFIDLERRQGTITILGQYNAFIQTQELLEIESRKLIESIDRQLDQAEELKIYAKDSTAKGEVMNWLSRSVIPNLIDARQKTMLLTESLSEFPQLPINSQDGEYQKQLTAEGNSKSTKPVNRIGTKKQTKNTKLVKSTKSTKSTKSIKKIKPKVAKKQVGRKK